MRRTVAKGKNAKAVPAKPMGGNDATQYGPNRGLYLGPFSGTPPAYLTGAYLPPVPLPARFPAARAPAHARRGRPPPRSDGLRGIPAGPRPRGVGRGGGAPCPPPPD